MARLHPLTQCNQSAKNIIVASGLNINTSHIFNGLGATPVTPHCNEYKLGSIVPFFTTIFPLSTHLVLAVQQSNHPPLSRMDYGCGACFILLETHMQC